MTTRHEWSPGRLERLLEAYGGDPARWPHGSAAGLEDFLVREPAARAALDEAKALDQLLDQAPAGAGDAHQALTARIMSAVARDGPRNRRAAAEGMRGKVIAWPGARDPGGSLRVARAVTGGLAIGQRQIGAAAALLAASLVVGFYLGAAGLARPALDPRGAVAELEGEAAPLLPPELTEPDEDVL